ncbi:MAG: hypothetical protein M3Z54_02090 [Gemmatimonadota bacterium]|nr:hypothetical protein [Gemmatimonadota bacterium]
MSPAVSSSKSPSSSDHRIRAVTVDGRKYGVSLRVLFDGVEHVGRLRFTDGSTSATFQDHGSIPGTTLEDAVHKAQEMSPTEMEQRCYRALSEKRRFSKLRNATDEMIEKIKVLNRVAVGLEKGIVEREAGQKELAEVEGELLDIVRRFRDHAGVEDGSE